MNEINTSHHIKEQLILHYVTIQSTTLIYYEMPILPGHPENSRAESSKTAEKTAFRTGGGVGVI